MRRRQSRRKRPAPTISRPGLVAIDVEVRRAKLIETDFLDMCRTAVPADLPPVMHKLITNEGNPDDRYLEVASKLRELGAQCLVQDKAACTTIQDYALDWARSSRLDTPAGGVGNTDNDLFWEDTLTVNMRLIGPMIAALSVAEQDTAMPPADRAILDPWLKKMVDRFANTLRDAGKYKGGRHGTRARRAANNHAVQSSIAAMAYGAWANDPQYFETGIEQWFITLESMRRDGSLPIETRRGARALFYHGRTITALMQLAERARVQGIDLYGSAPKRNKTIHKAVAFMIDAMEDPKRVFRYAKANVHAPGRNYREQDLGNIGSTLGWVGTYMARFPDHPNTRRLVPRWEFTHSEVTNYLTEQLDTVVRANGISGEWTGVDVGCAHSDPRWW